MATLLHLSFRAENPARSAALYAALLDGRVVDVGPPLSTIGVKSVLFGRSAEDRFADAIELWPAGKHWSPSGFFDIEGKTPPFGHFAVRTEKAEESLRAIAEKYGVTLSMEQRGLSYLVPVIYDYDGNFVEFFRMK
jgi:hypothetical protein